MKQGDTVFVNVKFGDIFSEDFTGTVVGFERENIQVVDQEGNVFDLDIDQLELEPLKEEDVQVQAIKLTEKQMVGKAMEFLGNCDADELARIIGDMYGVDCFENDGFYEATPNENYCGGLDDLKKSSENDLTSAQAML